MSNGFTIGGRGFFYREPLPLSGGTITGALTVTGTLTASGDFAHTGTNLGFYGAAVAARPAAYTQTYATAQRTHSALLSSALTAASGTADTTVQDVGAAFSQTTLNDNFKDVATQCNSLRNDVINVKNVCNQVLDDLQTLGLLQ